MYVFSLKIKLNVFWRQKMTFLLKFSRQSMDWGEIVLWDQINGQKVYYLTKHFLFTTVFIGKGILSSGLVTPDTLSFFKEILVYACALHEQQSLYLRHAVWCFGDEDVFITQSLLYLIHRVISQDPFFIWSCIIYSRNIQSLVIDASINIIKTGLSFCIIFVEYMK